MPPQEADTDTPVGRDAVATFAASGLALAIGFVMSVVVARTLGPAGQGMLSSVRTVAGVATSLLAIGAPAAVYYLASVSVRNVSPLVGTSLLYAALIAAIAAGGATLFADDLARAQEVDDDAWYLLAAALMPLAFLEYSALNLTRARSRFRLANAALIGSRIAGLVATVVLVVFLDLGVAGALAAFGVMSVAQIAATASVARGEGRPRLSRVTTGAMLSYGLRAQVGQLLRIATQRFDLLLLSLLASPETVGLYAVAQLVAELVLLVPQAAGWVISPSVATGATGPEFTHRQLRASGSLALIAAMALAALAPVVISLGYGPDFDDAIVPLLILLPGIWMFACAELVAFVLSARNRPGAASWLAFCAGVTTVTLDAILIPLWELEGAAIASCVGYAVYGLASLAVVSRSDRVPLTSLLVARPDEFREALATIRARLADRAT